MRSKCRPIAFAGAIACLALGMPQTHAEPISTYEQCVVYPVPKDFRWSRKTIEAFCADTFTAPLSRNDMDQLIESGQAAKLDARLDSIVGDYLAGKIPEGTAHYVYANFYRGDGATAGVIARWLQQSPRSAHALAARGAHHLRRGTDARGTAFIKDTPRANLDRMEHELALARTDLSNAIERDSRILFAYSSLIEVARMTDGDKSFGPQTLARALKVDPKNFYVRAAFSYMCTPRWGGSFEYMDRIATEADRWANENPRLVNLRAFAISQRGFEGFSEKRYEASLEHYARGLALGPVTGDLFTAGFMSEKLRRFPHAIEYYSQALRFSPRDSKLLQHRARSYVQLDQYDAAKADLDVVLEDVPNDSFALREYAFVLLEQKNYSAAALRLELARKSDPADLWVAERLAWVYIYSKRTFQPAQPLVTQLLAKNPKSGTAWLMRADLIQNLGGPGLHEAAENFVRYADPSVEEQRNALPKVKSWLASHPKD